MKCFVSKQHYLWAHFLLLHAVASALLSNLAEFRLCLTKLHAHCFQIMALSVVQRLRLFIANFYNVWHHCQASSAILQEKHFFATYAIYPTCSRYCLCPSSLPCISLQSPLGPPPAPSTCQLQPYAFLPPDATQTPIWTTVLFHL